MKQSLALQKNIYDNENIQYRNQENTILDEGFPIWYQLYILDSEQNMQIFHLVEVLLILC